METRETDVGGACSGGFGGPRRGAEASERRREDARREFRRLPLDLSANTVLTYERKRLLAPGRRHACTLIRGIDPSEWSRSQHVVRRARERSEAETKPTVPGRSP